VILAAAVAGVVLFIAACLGWTAYLVHLGTLDALALAEKAVAGEAGHADVSVAR
jgi:hypothetical protein